MTEVGLPIPKGSRFTETREVDGHTAYGGWVDSPPPPGYAQLVAESGESGWKVVDVVSGSEFNSFFNRARRLCAVYFANYKSQSAPNFYFWFLTGPAEDVKACSRNVDTKNQYRKSFVLLFSEPLPKGTTEDSDF
jgi:hypothetical protein